MESAESGEIIIDKPKEEDTRGIQEVFHRAWLATYPNEEAGITAADIEERFETRFSDETLEKRKVFYTNPPEGETWLVAKKNGVVAGIISVIKKADRNQLQRIYVHPDYFGNGIGTKLWKAAKPYMDITKDTHVNLVDYNDRARAFYEKLGFVDTGRRWSSKTLIFASGANPTEMEMVLKPEV